MLKIREARATDILDVLRILQLAVDEKELEPYLPPYGTSSRISRLPAFLFPTLIFQNSYSNSPYRTFWKLWGELEDWINRSYHRIIIAQWNAANVGFAYYFSRRDRIEIRELNVMKRHHMQGVGKALVRHIEEVAKKEGKKILETRTGMNMEGKPWRAYGFWTHMGFKDTGKRIETKYGVKYVVFTKKI